MKSVTPDEIYQNNLNCLNAHSLETLEAFQKYPLQRRIAFYPCTNSAGEANLMCQIPGRKSISLYPHRGVLNRMTGLMENWNIEAYDTVIFHGMGLGYGPLAALKLFRPPPRLIVIESEPAIFDLALHLVDLRSLLQYKRLDLFVGADQNPDNIISRCNDYVCFGTPRILAHPLYASIFKESFISFNEQLQSAVGRARDIYGTARKFGRRLLTNSIENLPSFFGGASLGSLAGKLEGIPAVCVAAGPSLDKALGSLAKIQDRALIVACDSAVAALLRHHIIPHMVVTVDLHENNFEKIRPVLDQLRKSALVFGLESNPDIVRAIPSRRRIGITADSRIYQTWIAPRWNLKAKLTGYNSVGMASIALANALGCTPIALVGMDLAIGGTDSHSKHAANHYQIDPSKSFKVDGVRGIPVSSLPQWTAERIQLEKTISDLKLKVIDTSIGGAFIEGSEIKTLSEFLATALRPDADVDFILSGLDWSSSIAIDEISVELKSMLDELQICQRGCLNGQRLSEKMLRLARTGHQIPVNDLTELNSHLDQFQESHRTMLGLLEIGRLSNLQDLYRSRELLESSRDQMSRQEILTTELACLASYYESQGDIIAYVLSQIHEKYHYFHELVQIDEKPVRSSARALALARRHAAAAELWQAEKAYQISLDANDVNSSAWRELIALYIEFGLWRTARRQLEKAADLFPQADWLDKAEEMLEARIGELYLSAGQAFKHQDLPLARCRLEAYLAYVPRDLKALNLKRELSRQLPGCSTVSHPDDIVNDQPSTELAGAIEGLCQAEKYERAIGIFEGMIEHRHPNTADLRWQIGQLRFRLGDVSSALWNLAQALELCADNHELYRKLQASIEVIGGPPKRSPPIPNCGRQT